MDKREWCVLDWWGSEWLYHHILYEYMEIDWSDCWIVDEVLSALWLIVLLFINSNYPQFISFYIESLWFEYELCVISDNLSFNISCFHHSIWYTIHTLYQHLLFISTHSTIYTLSEGWMIRRETAWMSV